MFVVIELQKNGDTMAHLVSQHNTLQEAESKFHQVLAAAAVSTVEKHSAVLIEDNGAVLRTECYTHEEAAE